MSVFSTYKTTIACALCDDCGPDYSTFRHPYLCKWCYAAKVKALAALEKMAGEK